MVPRDVKVLEFSGPRKSSVISSFVAQEGGASLAPQMGFTLFLHGRWGSGIIPPGIAWRSGC